MKYLGLLLFLGACQTPTGVVYARPDLKNQMLVPRAGHVDKLTSQRCTAYKEHTTICTNKDIVEYAMDGAAVRARLRSLKFQCDFNGARYRICEKSRGICQQTIVKATLFTPAHVKLLDYKSFFSDYQLLVDSGLRCAAQDSAYGRTMFEPK